MSVIQDMFDKTVNHMRAQGNPWGDFATRGWGYINPDNPCQRCAQGIHMDIDYETLKLTGKFFADSDKYQELLLSDTNLFNLMLSLQYVFEAVPVKNWEKEFALLADKYDLALLPVSSIKDKEVYNG